MNLFVAGLSYKTAPVEVREKLAVQTSQVQGAGCRVKLAGGLTEVVIVSTCNRVEVYGVTPGSARNYPRLFQELAHSEADFTPYLYFKEGAEAVRHLFSVAGGLDSMVLGETEITGQVKQAYQAAQQAGLTGRVTNRWFQTALQVAKQIRTQTALGRGATSVGSVAVELAERIFDQDLSDKSVLIIGAGKMGEACVRHLAKKGARSVAVANRSYERAQALASEFGGQPVAYERFLDAVAAADIVVSSTGAPEPILHREELARLMPARRNRPLFLIDIAVPRNIEAQAQQLDNVYLYDVDDLEALVRENVRLREQELAQCRAIVEARTTELLARLTPAPKNLFNRGVRSEAEWVLGGAAA